MLNRSMVCAVWTWDFQVTAVYFVLPNNKLSKSGPIQQQHAPLRVHSTVQRHQSPERPILHQISSCIYRKIQWREVIMSVLHPSCARPPRWLPPVGGLKMAWLAKEWWPDIKAGVTPAIVVAWFCCMSAQLYRMTKLQMLRLLSCMPQLCRVKKTRLLHHFSRFMILLHKHSSKMANWFRI